MKQTYRLAGTAGAVVAVLALSACSDGASGGQSVDEACTVAEEVMTTALDEMGTQLESTFTDIAYGIEVDTHGVFAPLNDAISDAVEQVSNTDVKGALVDFKDDFEAFAGAIESADIPDINTENVSDPELIAEQEAALEEFSATVETHARSLQASSAHIETLCTVE